MNADGLSAEAPLKVEVLDEKLMPVRSAEITKSGTRVEALALPKGRLAIRVSFGDHGAARLYALYLD